MFKGQALMLMDLTRTMAPEALTKSHRPSLRVTTKLSYLVLSSLLVFSCKLKVTGGMQERKSGRKRGEQGEWPRGIWNKTIQGKQRTRKHYEAISYAVAAQAWPGLRRSLWRSPLRGPCQPQALQKCYVGFPVYYLRRQARI